MKIIDIKSLYAFFYSIYGRNIRDRTKSMINFREKEHLFLDTVFKEGKDDKYFLITKRELPAAYKKVENCNIVEMFVVGVVKKEIIKFSESFSDRET